MVEARGQIELAKPSEVPADTDMAEGELTFLDFLLILTRNRRLIGITAAAFTALGVLSALMSPNEYTASARVIREAEGQESASTLGGLAALRGFGINLGGSSTGLSADAYPKIVESREVRLAVVRDTFYFPSEGGSTSFVKYVNRAPGFFGAALSGLKRYTIGLPGTISALIRDDRALAGEIRSAHSSTFPSAEEEKAIEVVADLVSTSVDQTTGLMTIQARSESPYLSAALTASFLKHLTERVRTIRTEKARQNLEFMMARFEEAQKELGQAEAKLGHFLDRNNNPQTAQLRIELDRLERNVSFKTQLYSDLQTQVTQAEIELQRSRPVITVLEEPTPRTVPSAPNRTLTVLLSLLLGGIVGTGLAVIRTVFVKQSRAENEREKLKEVRSAFISPRLARRIFGRINPPVGGPGG